MSRNLFIAYVLIGIALFIHLFLFTPHYAFYYLAAISIALFFFSIIGKPWARWTLIIYLLFIGLLSFIRLISELDHHGLRIDEDVKTLFVVLLFIAVGIVLLFESIYKYDVPKNTAEKLKKEYITAKRSKKNNITIEKHKKSCMKGLLILTAIVLLSPILIFALIKITSPVSLKWCYKTTGHHAFDYSSITIANDVLYMGNMGEFLYAVDKNTGEQKWKLYDEKALFSPPSVVGSVVYVGRWSYHENEKGYLYAIDVTNGDLKWSFELGNPSLNIFSPIIVDDTVYIGSQDYHLYAIDAESGKLKWRFSGESKWHYESEDSYLSPTPAFADDIVYIAGGNELYAVDANSGELKWRFETKSQITSTPSVANNVVYIGSRDSYLYAIGADSGELVWRYEAEGFIYTSIICDDTIYFGDAYYYLYAIDINSGELKWRFRTRNEITGSPAIVDGVIYMGSWDYYLYALDTKSGKKKWRYEVEGPIDSNIIVVDNVIYFGCRDDYIYALDLKRKQKK